MSDPESYFGGKVQSFEVEMMKFRRWLRGKEKELHIYRRMWEKDAEGTYLDGSPLSKESKEYYLKEAREREREEHQYGLYADAIDESLKRCKIDILPRYLLKSEQATAETGTGTE